MVLSVSFLILFTHRTKKMPLSIWQNLKIFLNSMLKYHEFKLIWSKGLEVLEES